MTTSLSRKSVVFNLVLLLALLAAGCGGTPGIPEEPSKPKVLTIALSGEPDSLDRNFGTTGAVSVSVTDAIYEALVKPDPQTGSLQPALATEWTVSDDRLSWTFKLREGVKFHNGEEFNAESVKYTIDRVKTCEDPVSPMRERIAPVVKTEVIDEYTVRFWTDEPFALLPQAISYFLIYPKKYYEEVGPEGFGAQPIGTGLFKFVEWVRGERIVLEGNKGHWEFTPQLDRVVFKFIPETSTRIAALERGEVDIAAQIPPDDAERLKAEGLDIKWSPLGQGMVIQLKSILPDAPFHDRRVRLAMNYAIDKQKLVDNLFLGYAKVLDGQMVGPECFGYNPDLEPYPYDPDKAKELLAEAGYPDGFRWTFNASKGVYLKQEEAIYAVIGELEKVGIEFDVDMREWGAYIKLGPQREVWYVGWLYYPVMDADWAMQHNWSESRYQQFSNKEYDELFVKQRSEFDPEVRKELLQQLMAVAHREAPVVFLWQAADVWAVNPRVQGFEATPSFTIYLENVTVTDD